MATIARNTTQDVQFSDAQLPVKVTGMQAMANKMWIPFIAMGFMVVLAAFIVGLVNSGITSTYFESSKAVREAAETGSALAQTKAVIDLRGDPFERADEEASPYDMWRFDRAYLILRR